MHSDIGYYLHSISPLTMEQLNIVMVYGVGAFALIIIPVFVIAVYEMKQVKQSQQGGLDVILSGIGKIFIYSVLFLFMVMLLLMALIGLSNSPVNPAFGIDQFFHVEWLDLAVMSSLDGGTIANQQNAMRLESARSMVALLSLFRFAYILLLMSFFLISLSFATGIVFTDHKKGNDNSAGSFIAHLLISVVISVLVFWAIIELITQVLNAILWFAKETQGTEGAPFSDRPINIMNDLVALFRIGLDYIESSLSAK